MIRSLRLSHYISYLVLWDWTFIPSVMRSEIESLYLLTVKLSFYNFSLELWDWVFLYSASLGRYIFFVFWDWDIISLVLCSEIEPLHFPPALSLNIYNFNLWYWIFTSSVTCSEIEYLHLQSRALRLNIYIFSHVLWDWIFTYSVTCSEIEYFLIFLMSNVRKNLHQLVLFGVLSLFNGISTFGGYLMPIYPFRRTEMVTGVRTRLLWCCSPAR